MQKRGKGQTWEIAFQALTACKNYLDCFLCDKYFSSLSFVFPFACLECFVVDLKLSSFFYMRYHELLLR